MSNFSISTKTEAPTTATAKGLYIANRDGSPRWVWSAASNEPVFLQFYQPNSWKQEALVGLVRLVFALRLQRIVFPSIPLQANEYTAGEAWAIFMGTPGPNRKQVVINDEGTITKVAASEMAEANLANEAFFLRHLEANERPFSFVAPKLVRHSKQALTMEKLPNQGTWSQFTEQHTNALAQLRKATAFAGCVSEWTAWEQVYHQINELKNYPHPRIPSGIVANLQRLVTQEDQDSIIGYGLAHGDFTPWNTLRTTNDQLGIIDWELARPEMPLGFDFFHFHLQHGILVERKNWNEIYTDIQALLTPTIRMALFGTQADEADRYLRLYLAYHVAYYLSLYQQQAEWHQQIYWQLDVWADALAALSPAADQRKALISRLFDTLNDQEYAVLKMDHEDPEALPSGSDLDVLVQKENIDQVISRLAAFPQLAYSKVIKKSFMASVFLLLEDGQVLNIDLIWKLKRKAVVFMDVATMIRNARPNSYGVSVVSPQDTQQYVRLFYGLNGAAVPAKFGFVEGAPAPSPVLPDNKGLRGVRNYLLYLLDILRTMVFNRGFVLTFSGVDGAGKSTVIEHVVRMLDKQFRRPVKVLRHRPSLLPILSAYRYGKEEAERKSVASLPRTGGNTSLLSSLFRFGYYYLDYLLGQWYVHLRYVVRGYVVVYDRYYYDFMIDGRRSNLELPQWITSAGFRLLRKPAFNFFLFADPATILARKQELTKDTIESLTRDYSALFERQSKASSSVFTSIKNIELEDTLEVIRQALLGETRNGPN